MVLNRNNTETFLKQIVRSFRSVSRSVIIVITALVVQLTDTDDDAIKEFCHPKLINFIIIFWSGQYHESSIRNSDGKNSQCSLLTSFCMNERFKMQPGSDETFCQSRRAQLQCSNDKTSSQNVMRQVSNMRSVLRTTWSTAAACPIYLLHKR